MRPPITRLTAVSLFSGAGGMDVGVHESGFEIVLANDIDPDACATYRLNHGEVIVEGSITSLMSTFDHLADVDLVFGGPPCQGFSVAGKMDPSDPRSSMMQSFFDVIDTVSPRAFICENVKALAVLSKWEPVRRELMERANRNYHATLIVVNASDFGVPQNRERMFIVGVRKDVIGGSRSAFADLVAEAIFSRRSEAETVGDLVRRLGRAGSATNSRVCNAKISFAKAPVMRKSPYAGMLFNGAGRPLAARGVASTLPASMGGNKTPIVDEAEIFAGEPSFVEQYHARLSKGGKPLLREAPKRLRRLTVDECLAIQTFPTDYKMHGSRSAMYRQIGNAVPCRLAAVVATTVREILETADMAAPLAAPLRLAVSNA